MLPEKVKLISLAREREPEYGRELGEWVREIGTQMPSAYAKLGETCAATTPPPDGVGYAATTFRPVTPSTNDATLAFSDCGVATEGSVGMRRSEAEGSPNEVSREAVARGRATSENAKSAYRERDLRSDADRLWEEAREMTHRFTPDWEKDQEYLSKIYAAARLGHLEAMTKLGEYAGRRGAVVEAFYWTLLAELKGATGLKVQLRELRSRWQALGCPGQYHNTYGDFTEEQGVFARAVLRLQCGVNPQYARARLKELAERGVEEARLFFGNLKGK